MKEKLLNCCSSASGGLSVLGGYNVCHGLCMGVATLLSVIGITVSGMPLLFLTRIAVPFWIVAVLMLGSMFVLWKYKGMNFSRKVMLANTGLIIAGTPFLAVNAFQMYFWFIGGILVIGSIIWAMIDRTTNKRVRHAKRNK